MKPNESQEIPADLARQLDAIERSANILPPHVLVESVFDLPAVPRRGAVNTPARHGLSTELRRSLREARRVRHIGLLAIAAGVLLATLGYVGMRLDAALYGIGLLCVSGALLGFACVSLYQANARVRAAEAALDRVDSKVRDTRRRNRPRP